MRRATELALLRRFFAQVDARGTDLAPAAERRPACIYTDPARLTAEFTALFRGAPLLVALTVDVPGPGDFLATEVAGLPLLLVRDDRGALRGFVNACRHRGSPVAAGRGQAKRTLTCPYHAWTYGLDGALVARPGACGGFDGPELAGPQPSLTPVPVAERFGVIFARPGGDAPIDIDAHLQGMGEELQALDLGRICPFAERDAVWSMNWKQAVDTFTESYHVAALHRKTIAREFFAAPSVGLQFGPHAFGTAMRRSALELRGRPEDEWCLRDHASLVTRIFPNVIFNQPSDGHLELWTVYPEGRAPGRTRVSMRFYTPGPVRSDRERDFWQKNLELTASVVFGEDFPAQEAIFRGLSSGAVREVIFGRNEPGMIQFHSHVEQAIAAGASHRA